MDTFNFTRNIHLKISPGLCFVNNHNPDLLKAWETIIGIQQVQNYHKALTYMTGYFSKFKRKVSESLRKAARELKCSRGNLKITYSFISTHQLSVQEAVYNVLPEIWS